MNFSKLRMSPLYLNREQVHHYTADMLHHYSMAKRTKEKGLSRTFHIFTSGSMTPEGSAKRTTKKKKLDKEEKNKRNQCLLVKNCTNRRKKKGSGNPSTYTQVVYIMHLMATVFLIHSRNGWTKTGAFK